MLERIKEVASFGLGSKLKQHDDVTTGSEIKQDLYRLEEKLVRRLKLPVFNDLLKGVKNAQNPLEKGKSMERLARYLLESIEGFSFFPSKRTSIGEIDGIVYNMCQEHPVLRELGSRIGVECKNWVKTIKVRNVKCFIFDLLAYGCRSGFFITKSGITGSRFRDAWGAIKIASSAMNAKVIVFTWNDLRRIGNAENPVSLIREKYENILL